LSNSRDHANLELKGEVFVDFDGTITATDTQELLMRRFAGDQAFFELQQQLAAGRITVRQALDIQVESVRGASFDEVVMFLLSATNLDRGFQAFAWACHEARLRLCVLSAGMRPIIRALLDTLDLPEIPVIAGDLDLSLAGWHMVWPDHSPNGIDKRAYVESAKRMGRATTVIGNGVTDYEAALIADHRFARAGDLLERMLIESGVDYAPFYSFADLTVTNGLPARG
jgi:2,3-diketo-5-methylthio-1-phosphopentane phosphatase